MTMTEHPITPPPELVHQWAIMFEHFSDDEVFTQVARWGANQELEACCLWLSGHIGVATADILREARRRPKPLSLKKQALEAWEECWGSGFFVQKDSFANIIRQALEALPND